MNDTIIEDREVPSIEEARGLAWYWLCQGFKVSVTETITSWHVTKYPRPSEEKLK